MLRNVLLILSILIIGSAVAQTPCFTIDAISGCTPHTINVTDCSGHPVPPQYSYAGEPFTVSTTHTFSSPGTYNVIQAIDIGGIFDKDTQTVMVFPIPTPDFEVTNCGANQVRVVIPNLGYDEYNITWETGVTQTFATSGPVTYTYSGTTSQTIRLEGLYQPENCGNDTSLSITPITAFQQANIDTLEVLTDTSIRLVVTGQNRVAYQLDMFTNGTLSNTHEVIPDGNTFVDTITGINTTTNTYCFVVKAFNKCANAVETTSDEVCSVVLSGASQVGYNEVNWNNYTGDNFQLFELERNNSLLSTFSSGQTPYADSNILCSQQYNYQVITRSSNLNPSISISNNLLLSGESAANPTAVTSVFSTYNDNNELEISWGSAPNIVPLFYTVNGTETSDTSLVLNTLLPNCYTITYTDSCDNTSAISEETCPIILNGKQNGMFGASLSWNHYQSFTSGIAFYELDVWDGQNQFIESVNVGNQTTYDYNLSTENNQQYQFRITGVSNDSARSKSNRITLVLQNRMLIPNAFSPDGDGNNDIFAPKTRFVDQFQMAIYNKWGEQLYVTDDLNNGWRGDNVPPGVYTYVITITDFLGETTTEKGTVTLIR